MPGVCDASLDRFILPLHSDQDNQITHLRNPTRILFINRTEYFDYIVEHSANYIRIQL